MGTLMQDLRYGLRMLVKAPGFTAVAVLTLALGIGANTAIFSLIDAVMLRGLPVHDPARLVAFKWSAHGSANTAGYMSLMSCPGEETRQQGCSFSYPMLQRFSSLSGFFSGVAAMGGTARFTLTGNGPARIATGQMVTGNFFETLGVSGAIGRMLQPADDTRGAPAVAVLSYRAWQTIFGGDPGAVGKTIRLDAVPVTIVGVATKDFPSLIPGDSDTMWLPLSLQPQLENEWFGTTTGKKPSINAGDDIWWVYVVGRLQTGVDLARAQSAASVVFQDELSQNAPQVFKPADAPRILLVPAPQAIAGIRERLTEPLLVLLFAVGTILLIACANVAGLVLARSARRVKEISLRLALGASHFRIVRQVLTESILLSLAGGVLGVLLAYWATTFLVAFMSGGGLWPRVLQVQPDANVLSFALAASLLTGILFGLAPASRIFRVDLTSALKESSGASASVEHRASRRWSLSGALVVAQIALSALALVGAGLLVRTLQNLRSINVGFDTRNILTFGIDPTLNGYSGPQIQSLYDQLRARINAIPGVLSSTYSFDALLSGNWWNSSFHLLGSIHSTEGVTEALGVGPDFIETMGIPLLSGRALKLSDFDPTLNPRPVLVNQLFAKRFFENQNPLGHRFDELCHESACEVVGVVGNAKYENLRKPLGPVVYVPQQPSSAIFEVHTAGNPVSAVSAIREAVGKLDANLPIFNVTTQSAKLDQLLFQNRLVARLSSFFGTLALLLACIGVYGLLSYEVACRTREIGVRMALGAQPADVLRMVIEQGMFLAVAGIVAGIAGALALTRFLRSLLFEIKPMDPATFIGAAILLALVALAACYIPARRATRVDPMEALRYE